MHGRLVTVVGMVGIAVEAVVGFVDADAVVVVAAASLAN